jgi:multicomponent Na+:H+ antiporter subunit E
MIFVFTAMWIILNEKAGPMQIISGIGFSVLSIFFVNYYLLDDDYIDSYFLNPVSLLKYLFYLVFQIYKSGISAIFKISKGESAVKIIKYDSCLNKELAVCLLANAITLTPGTVTIDKTKNQLSILCFQDDEVFSSGSGGKSCSDFEKILRGI